ncbi:GNAT family N-acetyltransferase [Cryptosporangium arvum]|uniref:GNAT family N-acetyltransferase n=1 Tax=Cryptosporangium arvum TaxID=80871 RepID=UPI0012EE5756|nr:GNAT family N-acetyltransferase [Cryptosporangium arvum]
MQAGRARTGEHFATAVSALETDYWEHLCSALGHDSEKWPQLGAAASRADRSGSFFNNATVTRPLGDSALGPALDQIDKYFTIGDNRRREFSINSYWPDLDLTGHGYRIRDRLPVMLRPAAGRPPESPEALIIRCVDDADGVAAFEKVFIESFSLAEYRPHRRGILFDQRIVRDPKCKFWVGWENGHPVACVTAFVAHGYVGVFNTAVLPSARRKGYGAAMTWCATFADPALPAVLQATVEGESLYRSMGYSTVGTFTSWHRRRRSPGALLSRAARVLGPVRRGLFRDTRGPFI